MQVGRVLVQGGGAATAGLAEELGLGFTLEELRKYETRLKVMNSRDIEDDSDSVPDPVVYQLLDHGWETADSVFEEAEGSFRNK